MASEVGREDEIGFGWQIAVFAGLAALALLCAPFVGMDRIPFSALWGEADDPADVTILWELRIPPVLMAFLAGAALATSGMVFQAMFRNPLATPYTLGVSSGAALGASLAIQFGAFAWLRVSSVSLAAFAGAVLSMGLVYAITSRSRQGLSTATMLLAGVGICVFFSSLILFLQYVGQVANLPGQIGNLPHDIGSPAIVDRSFRMIRWTMGGLESIVQFRDVLSALPFVVSGCLIVWYLSHELNLLATGEEFAFSRGVNVERTKLLLLLGVSLMLGAVVSICGPIGFVGLIAPHLCRLVVGPDHRRLYPTAWLFGGAFFVTCDTAARTLMAPTELPVGIITALFGGPFFLWLLLARRQDFGTM